MLDKYKINNTKYLDPPKEFLDENLMIDFEKKLEDFKEDLKNNVRNKVDSTYYKFGDGDYYFLNKMPKGSAKPGRRALKKPYFLINHKKFVAGAKKNDYYFSQLPSMHQKMFNEVFGKKPNYPSEFVYGLIANQWILKTFNRKIGLVGADKKLELIELLMNNSEYKDYLGIDEFNDYISIPQRFACDNLSKTLKTVEKQLKNSNCEIYLVGVGHVKSGLLHQLKEIKNAVYLDVGVGIDALAGIINLTRPYFGNWRNYQLKDHNLYREIDFLVNKNNYVKNITYL